MRPAPPDEATLVLAQALDSLTSGLPAPILGPDTVTYSERCVEVPWVAAHLGEAQRLLDVGWAMSPPEWLGVLLALRRRGCQVTGIDIIDPQRVKARYPADIVDEVLSVPVRVENVLDAQPTDGRYDAITCVSTLEHIGFDVASGPETTDTAFVRARTPEEADPTRDADTDRRFLDAAADLLEPGGVLLLSVPAGFGTAILHRDSLGLFTHQYEYDEAAWTALTADDRFSIVSEAFYRHDEEQGWQHVPDFAQLTDQTSALKPFATGCAMVILKRH